MTEISAICSCERTERDSRIFFKGSESCPYHDAEFRGDFLALTEDMREDTSAKPASA